jgi:uncharacterized protein
VWTAGCRFAARPTSDPIDAGALFDHGLIERDSQRFFVIAASSAGGGYRSPVTRLPSKASVGLGFRAELAADLVGAPSTVDFVEVVAETCYTQRTSRREACAVAEIWPVVPHGVKLSLGSAEGVDLDHARRLGALARELRAGVISEHVSFTRAGSVDIGHLTQLPRTREAIRVVARNVAQVRRVLPDVPMLLENVAWSVRWPDDEMDEPTFYQEIVAATDCELLLDVSNLFANALNEGLDPIAVLADYPLDRIGMIHVAGGVWEDGFYFDTHAHPVPRGVLDLVARCPAVPVLIERDANFDFAELSRELAALRALPRTETAPRVRNNRNVSDNNPLQDPRELAAAQTDLAAQLAGVATEPTPLATRIGLTQLERARGILHRKRFDDALPLLANLSRSRKRVRDLAATALPPTRPSTRAAPADAWRIAEVALADPELADAAAVDRLLLRARFTGFGGAKTLQPRRAPFVGSAVLANGRRVRARKGVGVLAEVTMREGG